MKVKYILNTILVLGVSFLTACGDGGGAKEATKETTKTTKLTYTINAEKDSDGIYVIPIGKEVTISASADGPNKDKVKWTYDLTLKNGQINSEENPELAALLNTKSLSPGENLTFKAKRPIIIVLNCHPAGEKTVDGVKLYEGKQSFEIVFTNPSDDEQKQGGEESEEDEEESEEE